MPTLAGSTLIPQSKISTPGVEIFDYSAILLEVGDGSTFKSAGHLAAYARIAPVTQRSGEHPARSGNHN